MEYVSSEHGLNPGVGHGPGPSMGRVGSQNFRTSMDRAGSIVQNMLCINKLQFLAILKFCNIFAITKN